jgi:WD40 repeat protein
VNPSLADSLNDLSITDTDNQRDVRIEEGPVCWTDCVCPPALRKVNSTHCMRCWNRGHTALVRTLCLNGDNLISGGYDGTVKVSLLSYTSSNLSPISFQEEEQTDVQMECSDSRRIRLMIDMG